MNFIKLKNYQGKEVLVNVNKIVEIKPYEFEYSNPELYEVNSRIYYENGYHIECVEVPNVIETKIIMAGGTVV